MPPKTKRRKCRGCSDSFCPDYRNKHHQHYCCKPACPQASNIASQRRWLHKLAKRAYFRGPDNAKRVGQWREAHPGYWKRKTPRSYSIQTVQLQEFSPVQSPCYVPGSPLGTLQDFCLAKDPGFIGLLSMITGRTLQGDITTIARRVVEQGQQILGLSFPEPLNQSRFMFTKHLLRTDRQRQNRQA